MSGDLLVVAWSRTGGTKALVDAVQAGAEEAIEALGTDRGCRESSPLETRADDVRACGGIVLATPENFGYMSGAMKLFFDEVFYELNDDTRGLPCAIVVRAGHDGSGAVRSIEPLVTGLGWRAVAPPLVAVGELTEEHLGAAHEIGAMMLAGLDSGIW